MTSSLQALSPTKKLRTGRSVWSDTAHPPLKVHALHRSLKADIAIVGAGISGAFMAEALSRQYENIVVLDRREPALGSTHGSTAMLQYEIDTPLQELADRIGFAKASRAWRRSFRATQDLIALVRRENIRCGLEARSALYLAGDAIGARGMAAECRARHRAGLDCVLLPGKALAARYDIDRTAALLSGGAAVADPVALARGLLRRARSRGTRIFAPADVQEVLATRHGVVLDVGGVFVEARHAVFCTGYEMLKQVPRKGVRITSSWAAATAPRAAYPAWLDRTLVWEAADPYLYMRTTTDGRLIVGGEDAGLDSPSYRANTLDLKGRRLAGKTRRLLGVEPEWSHVWAGAFGESDDGLPVIDAVPGLPNCFVVMGFGGNGTVFSMLAAQIMPGLLRGRRHFDVDLFRFR